MDSEQLNCRCLCNDCFIGNHCKSSFVVKATLHLANGKEVEFKEFTSSCIYTVNDEHQGEHA